METLLRQSRAMCPFLNKTSPATLRSLSTATSRQVSPGGGTMSNLQVLARRCPVMGKAMAVQTAKTNNSMLSGAFGGTRAYTSKARMHTTRPHHANIETNVSRQQGSGMSPDRMTDSITNAGQCHCHTKQIPVLVSTLLEFLGPSQLYQ